MSRLIVGLAALVSAACTEADPTPGLVLSDLPPVEFREVASLGGYAAAGVDALADGGLCAWDVQQMRITAFAPDGSLVGSGSIDVEEMRSLRPSFVGFADDCSLVVKDGPDVLAMRDEPEGMRRDSIRFTTFDPSGRQVARLVETPDAERWFWNREGGWGFEDPVFGDRLQGVVSGGRLWVGLSSSLEWARIDLVSRSVDTLGFHAAAREVTTAEVSAERVRRAALVEGEVAARQERFDRAMANWIAITPDGSLGGRVLLDVGVDVLSATTDVLVVLSPDELDAPVVRVMRR